MDTLSGAASWRLSGADTLSRLSDTLSGASSWRQSSLSPGEGDRSFMMKSPGDGDWSITITSPGDSDRKKKIQYIFQPNPNM